MKWHLTTQRIEPLSAIGPRLGVRITGGAERRLRRRGERGKRPLALQVAGVFQFLSTVGLPAAALCSAVT